MDRKKFIHTGIASAALLGIGKLANSKPELNQVGFEHLPNKEIKTMKTILHKADTRGYANHGWLNSHHSFSFANYYNPERMQFGALRVLNDDIVSPSMGFNTHPHNNMEIISIPLSGDLEHKDSMGNTQIIKQGDIQIMSAGKGIQHSEKNKNSDKEVKFLQIWVLPKELNIQPRYDQKTFSSSNFKNKLTQIVSPAGDAEGIDIHQNAWFSMGELDKDFKTSYQIKQKNNGAYFFVLEGIVWVNNQLLEKRDGYGIWDTDKIEIKADSNSKILIIDVPMDV
ncbi:MAG: pirin family protein [Bacteroidetes bacterium]|nr:pirin family protein [Bacteroidota bacterium]